MASLNYLIFMKAADGEPFIAEGSVPFEPGVTTVALELPKGVITSVTAAVTMPLREGERIFMNGFQTWTYSPEYTPNDRIRGLTRSPLGLCRKLGLDRFGDEYFTPYPNKKGITHGVSYGYFRTGDTFRLFGSLSEKNGYTLFSYDAKEACLNLRRDCEGLAVDGPFEAFRLFYSEGSSDDVFGAWFAAMDRSPRSVPTGAPIAGYSSWYNRYQAITEALIDDDLNSCAEVLKPGDLFQVDDGWEPFVGDWLEPDPVKFPGGMKALCERIHAKGFKAGLWLAPFVCETKSKTFREHPDWLYKVGGAPWREGLNWSGFYALNFDHPGVREYLTETFRRVFDEWGFDLVKLDFLYGAAPYGTPADFSAEHPVIDIPAKRDGRFIIDPTPEVRFTETRAAREIRGLEFLRELCGDKLILGCGTPIMPSFGLFDYCRISCDVGLDWDDKLYMKLAPRERVSTKHAIANSVLRRPLDGRAHGNDPDVFFLRSNNLKLKPNEKKLLAEVNALLGTVFLTSDNMSAYTDEQKAEYKRVRAIFDEKQNVRIEFEADGTPVIRYTLEGEEKALRVER